ncbi:MAG TPA: VOC family protein [Gaiellaceae bacterium]|nr:VOC family protein [Gaiellaceae bacterium]
MEVQGLVFAGVASPDPAALAAFFAGVLGGELVEEDGWRRLVFPDGTSLALVPEGWVPPPSDTNLGFLVADLDAATRELAASGVEPDGEGGEGGGLRYRHFRAPDGRRFELVERP